MWKAEEDGILDSLKKWKIKFNPRPFLNPKSKLNIIKDVPKFTVVDEKPTVAKRNFVNLHAEVARKVDVLISNMEQEAMTEETVLDARSEENDISVVPGKTLLNVEDNI